MRLGAKKRVLPVFGLVAAVWLATVALRAQPPDVADDGATITTTTKTTAADTAHSTTTTDPSTFRLLLDNPIVALFAIIAFGLALGRVKVWGVSLGTSGVIFVALAFGAVGCSIPGGIDKLGLTLFVYCIGIAAGPGFFRAFFKQGGKLAKLAVALVGVGAATTAGLAWLLRVPTDLAVGLFAGAMTSTPALAAGLDVFNDAPAVSVGYGIAYSFGVVGVVLFVQVLPRALKVDLDAEAKKIDSVGPLRRVRRALVEVVNPAVVGKQIGEVAFLQNMPCQVSRVLRGERLAPVTPETTFEAGAHYFVVGREDSMPYVVEFLGRESDRQCFMDTENERRPIVATSAEVVGRELRELGLLRKYGVTVSRITRNDVDFVPQADTVIQTGDALMVVGEPKNLRRFAEVAGHRARALDETDLISLAAGVAIGVIVGMMPIALPGTKGFTLGLSGGPLLVGLVLGHFGKIGRIRGHIPRAARSLMSDIGLVFFLAAAGVKAGDQFLDVLRAQGVTLLAMGAAVTILPMIVGYFVSRRLLGQNSLQTLGGICGGMTSTPGLGALASKTDSDAGAISYAAAYPVALILMTVMVQILASVLK